MVSMMVVVGMTMTMAVRMPNVAMVMVRGCSIETQHHHLIRLLIMLVVLIRVLCFHRLTKLQVEMVSKKADLCVCASNLFFSQTTP